MRLPEGFDATGIRDSKQLGAKERDALYLDIVRAADYAVVVVPAQEVDRLNILRATLIAMGRAIRELDPTRAVADGNQQPIGAPCPVECLVKGDSKDAAIAAASILAKVTRDRLMVEAANVYPEYGFDTHFGYHNPTHIANLNRFGPCPIHRRSFEPVKSMVNQPVLF